MTEATQVTAGQIASAHLYRVSVPTDQREPDSTFIPGRRESRALVVAAGLSDDDIDRMIKQARQEVEPHLDHGQLNTSLRWAGR